MTTLDLTDRDPVTDWLQGAVLVLCGLCFGLALAALIGG